MFSAEEIRRLLDYDPETGNFRWRKRPLRMFTDLNHWAIWNSRFAGEIAGGIYGNGYRYIGIEPKSYLAHRLAWLIVYNYWPKGIDHINGNKDDNRIANLRLANHAQNAQNQKLSQANTSGYTGVGWHGQRGRWVASITKNGRKISLGLYDNKDDAYQAVLNGKRKHHTFNPEPRV